MPPQPQQNLMNLDDRPPPRSSREARAAARAAKNGTAGSSSSHYRRGGLSPDADLDEYAHFSGPEDREIRSPPSDIALQDAILAQAQQQRMVPVGQLSRNAPPQRRPAPGQSGAAPSQSRSGPVPPSPKSQQQQPPSYPGGPAPMDDGGDGRNGSSRGHYRRNTGRRPSEPENNPPASSSAPDLHPSQQSPSRSNANMNGRGPNPGQQQQRRNASPGSLSVDGGGGNIARLNSPSVMKSVLQPLEQKMHEYDHLMQDAHNQMVQLDEEIRMMQERRAQAEERFIEAKAKHDDYERQHAGVGRAMRGEPDPQRMPSPEPVQRMVRMESFVDERPMTSQSSHKGKGRSRLRLSLFKN